MQIITEYVLPNEKNVCSSETARELYFESRLDEKKKKSKNFLIVEPILRNNKEKRSI